MTSDWPRVKASEACESIVDCVNKTAKVVEHVTPYKMIRTTNVRDGYVNIAEVRHVDKDTYEKWTRRQVPKPGDVILTREAPLGEVGMIRTNEKVFLGQRLMSYRADKDKLDKHFLLYSLMSHDLQGQIKETSSSLVINQRCIRENRVNLESARGSIKKVPPEKLVRFGDVLVNSTGVGTLGRVAQAYEDFPDCTVDSHVTIIRAGEALTTDYFGVSLIRMQSTFENLGVGSTGQTELSRQSIGNVDVLVPPLNVQQHFSLLVEPMRKEVPLLIAKNQNLRRTRDLLLPKLISGELSVSQLGELPETGQAA